MIAAASFRLIAAAPRSIIENRQRTRCFLEAQANFLAGFLQIAVANMANAIKQVSVQKGHDATRFALQCIEEGFLIDDLATGNID